MPLSDTTQRRTAFRRGGVMALLGLLAACQTTPQPATPPTSPELIGETRPGSGYLKGYLDRSLLPDSLALLPAPPVAGSAQEAADLEAHRRARALRAGPRGTLAAQDVNLKFPQAAQVFSCALDLPISQAQTPHLSTLLRRTLVDSGLASYKAKDHYKRLRPYSSLGEGTCAPAEEAQLAKDGAYPSGHAALGWAWALALAGLAPDKADAVLQRGHAFGQSRVVCGYHWQSDVDAGRVIGAAAFARLQADPTYRAQAELAKAEIATARRLNLRSAPEVCSLERSALSP